MITKIIAGLMFVVLQAVLMILQLIAGIVGAALGFIVVSISALTLFYKWGMPKLYSKAIEWRFKGGRK